MVLPKLLNTHLEEHLCHRNISHMQFFFGKTLGSLYNDRISGGQALGQKNTILAIWMAHTYLNPLSSVAPGSYVLWQNIINSYQLWKKRKKEIE